MAERAQAGGSAESAEGWQWPPLRSAQRAMLRDVLVHGARSRADLTRRSGMSRASLSRMTRELADLGLVREGAALPEERRGRPSETIELAAGAAHFVGFKLTGESLYLAVTDLAATVVHSEGEALTTTAVGDVVAQMSRAVERIRARHPRIAAVGVCLAGDVKTVGGRAVVVGSAFLGWDEVALEEIVAREVRLPVAVSNDVQALTTAHHWFGPGGVAREPFVVVALGEGIGSGIVADGELVRGAHGRPGRIGHLPVTGGGPRCDRGHAGCVSAYATVPAILRNSGGGGFWETLEAARRGEERADGALRDAGTALGAAVAALVNIVDPESVLITGEALAVAEYASDDVHRSIRERLDPGSPVPQVELGAFEFTDYAWGAAINAIRALV
ncbi:MAG: ROK family protein [Candidatus Microbacterium stercoravium]